MQRPRASGHDSPPAGLPSLPLSEAEPADGFASVGEHREAQWDIVPVGFPTLSSPTWPMSTLAKEWLTNG